MIYFLDENFSSLNSYLSENKGRRVFVLVDENTKEYCLPIFLDRLNLDTSPEILEIKAGEPNKNISTSIQLWETLSRLEADRSALMLNLGGGMISDIGGFVASTYKRGIRFVNVPTTLLAMVDASIGGKTGIDHQFYKNIIGTFCLPEAIFISPDFIKTIPFSELRSGFAEMLKHGLIASRSYWDRLVDMDGITPESISSLIEESVRIKQGIVENDPKEKNIRKSLNFGHSIGHALEALFLKEDNFIPHGEAVAAGMICESFIAHQKALISEDELQKIVLGIGKFFPYLGISHFDFESLFSWILNDKKNEATRINFSLIRSIGQALYDVKVDRKEIEESISYYKSMQKKSC